LDYHKEKLELDMLKKLQNQIL